MTIPAPYRVPLIRPTVTGTDGHGNGIVELAEVGLLACHFVQPGVMDEPGRPNRDVELVEYTLGCPPPNATPPGAVPAAEVTAADLVRVDGEVFRVHGRPRRFDRGPWPFAAEIGGTVIELRRADG